MSNESVNFLDKRKVGWKVLIALQLIVLVYTLSGVAAKHASSTKFLSFQFVLFYGLEIAILGVYAVLWQQIIKRIDLSIAYANRAIALLWSMLWSFLIFKESVSIKNLIGVVIVIIGTIIVNSDDK